jgi:hypothetical protein
VDGGIEIARDREIDQQQLPAAPVPLDGLGVEHDIRRARRRDDDVDRREVRRELVAVGLAVRGQDDLGAARPQVSRRLLADLACADHQDAAAVEIAEDLLGECRRSGGDGRRALADRRLRPHLSSRVQCIPEETVEQQSGRPVLVGRAHLAEDLAFARHERVQPGGDAEEMECGRTIAEPVQRGLDVGERCDGATFGLLGVVGGDVDLGAVAGRQHDSLAELLCERVRLLRIERNALPQLDGSVMVRRADEDEMHQAK